VAPFNLKLMQITRSLAIPQQMCIQGSCVLSEFIGRSSGWLPFSLISSWQGGNHAHMPSNEADLHLILCGVVFPVPSYTSGRRVHFLTKIKHFHCQGMHSRRWLTSICSWCQGDHGTETDSVLNVSVSLYTRMYINCCSRDFTRPYAVCLPIIFNSAFTVVLFWGPIFTNA
jgi:hypothetical protein